jgi:hypothetical protein
MPRNVYTSDHPNSRIAGKTLFRTFPIRTHLKLTLLFNLSSTTTGYMSQTKVSPKKLFKTAPKRLRNMKIQSCVHAAACSRFGLVTVNSPTRSPATFVDFLRSHSLSEQQERTSLSLLYGLACFCLSEPFIKVLFCHYAQYLVSRLAHLICCIGYHVFVIQHIHGSKM